MKKKLSLLLAMILCIYLISPISFAINDEALLEADDHNTIVDSGQCGNDVSWMLDSEGLLIIYGRGYMWDFSDGFIDKDSSPLPPWRQYIHDIKEIRIEDGVENIGKFAFAYDSQYGCSYDKLQAVYISESVHIIGDDAFLFASNLKKVDFDTEGIRTIGQAAFLGTAIESIFLPPSLSEVCDEAFAFTPMKNIVIPPNVSRIGNHAFGYYSYNSGIYPINGFTIYGYPGSGAERYFQSCLFSDYQDWKKLIMDWDDEDTLKENFPADGNVYFVDLSRHESGEKNPPVNDIPPFIDVPSISWFAEYVFYVFKKGLMIGISDTIFDPQGSVTLAQTITMAARIHRLYTTGEDHFDQSEGADWYKVYVDYARKNQIIDDVDANLDLKAKATRVQFADIFASSLPDQALEMKNNVPDHSIPDVSMNDSYAANVYKLYRAGVLTGNDEKGTFAPLTSITRAEAAAIVSRMVDVNNRKTVSLADPFL